MPDSPPLTQPGKRERLVASAGELLHRRGAEGPTLAEIAHAADVPPGNVYYYFKTRDELVRAVIAARADEVRALLASIDGRSTPRLRLKAMTRSWTDMADPEGGELCAFVREPERLPDYRLYEVVVDSADPPSPAGWWAERFGVPAQHDHEEGFSWLDEAPGRPWERIFTRVPEPKTVKNRIHWDAGRRRSVGGRRSPGAPRARRRHSLDGDG